MGRERAKNATGQAGRIQALLAGPEWAEARAGAHDGLSAPKGQPARE